MTPAANPLRNALAAVALLAIGAAGAVVAPRLFRAPTATTPGPGAPLSVAPATGTAISVTLSAELVSRAGIRTAEVRAAGTTPSWRSPGNVEANAYRQVVVTPVAGGRVTAVSVELGQHVTEGQTLVEIYSPELADAERAYLTARADLDLANQRRVRTEKLAAIGAVSQQELDDTRAEYARRNNGVESERSRLRLLGLSAETITAILSSADITSIVRVPAPSTGVVIKRSVNRGQNVDAKMELLTIADLSTVWVIADVYERDMSRVHVGSEARVTSVAVPGQVWSGRVAYLDPQVSAETRTLKARVEVRNPALALKPGMLVDVQLSDASGPAVVIMPRTAVQQMGAATLVFVPDVQVAGRYTPRSVALGAIVGDDVEVRGGVGAGERVVTDGAFALKAEWERIGGALPPAASSIAPPLAATATAQRVTLEVAESGFVPVSLRVVAGRPIDLVVTRTTDKTCGTEIVIGDNVQRAPLPLNKPVTLHLPAMAKGELSISCGMAMLKGTVVAR